MTRDPVSRKLKKVSKRSPCTGSDSDQIAPFEISSDFNAMRTPPRYCDVLEPLESTRTDTPKSPRLDRFPQHGTLLVFAGSLEFNGTVTSSNTDIGVRQSLGARGRFTPSPTKNAHNEGKILPGSVLAAHPVGFTQRRRRDFLTRQPTTRPSNLCRCLRCIMTFSAGARIRHTTP